MRRSRLAVGLWALLFSLSAVGSLLTCSQPPHDPARFTAERFSDLYFRRADAAAALPLTTGEAETALREELRRLAGVRTEQPVAGAVHLVHRSEYDDGTVVKFRAEVRVPPHAGAPRGRPALVIPFDLFLSPTDEGWRITAWHRNS